MPYDCDVLVIGSGAGGATLAHACATAGKRVVVLERGHKFVPAGPGHDEQAMLIDKLPYDDRAVEVNGRPRRLYTGGVVGGSTAVYGAALMRPSPEDFHPGRYYGRRLPRAIWDWAIPYETFAPYYTAAEQLYGVAGANDDCGPLPRPPQGFPGRMLPLAPINDRLMATNRTRGLKPFRLPLAIDFHRCLRCSVCPGYVCPTGARRTAAQLLEPVAGRPVQPDLLTGAEVEQLCIDGRGRVSGVRIHDRATGRMSEVRARRYVLAAGAIGSAILLLKSGLGGPLVGRHYMFHLSPLAAGVFAAPTGAEAMFVKQVGFADYYFGTRRFPHKMGLVQSLPVPGPLMLAKVAGRWLPRGAVGALRKRLLPLAGIVEDLPNPTNRVTLDASGRVRLRHAFAAYDLERGRQLVALMRRILKRTGALFSLSSMLPPAEHVGHQCGTLRFGTDPATAVLDPDCRLFGQPDVFVADGSFFPTSLGVGPSLTIMANALRVADLVVKEI